MALCLATSLIQHGDFNPYDQLVRYKWWHQNGYLSSTGKCFDIGMATADSMSEFYRRQKSFAERHQIPLDQIDQPVQDFNVFCSGPDVAGNGALMRLAPVPLFFYQQPHVAVEYSGISGRITHGDRKAYDACRYYGALIVAALHGESKESLLSDSFYSDHQSWFAGRPLHESIALVSRGSFKRQSGIRGTGYIVSALEAALWAFWSDENSFEKGALAAVNLGDDTDTTAAIYGQLAGAFYSYPNLPQKWLDHLYARKFIESISGWLLFEGNRWNAEQIKSKL